MRAQQSNENDAENHVPGAVADQIPANLGRDWRRGHAELEHVMTGPRLVVWYNTRCPVCDAGTS